MHDYTVTNNEAMDWKTTGWIMYKQEKVDHFSITTYNILMYIVLYTQYVCTCTCTCYNVCTCTYCTYYNVCTCTCYHVCTRTCTCACYKQIGCFYKLSDVVIC